MRCSDWSSNVCSSDLDIEDDGTIKIASSDPAAADAAIQWIKSIVSEPEVGVIYKGKIVKIVDFGAFVNFFGSRDGLVHVSEMASRRVNKPSDVVAEGQAVRVKVLGIDERGKVRLSRSEERRVGKESVSTCKSRWSPDPQNKKTKKK